MQILREKNAILIVLATLFSSIGKGLNFVAATWLVYKLSSDPKSVGVFIAITSIPGILTFPFTGVLADRFNRKKIALIMDVIRAILVLIVPVTNLINETSLLVLYLVTFFITVADNFFYPAMSGIIKQLPQEMIGKVVSSNATSVQLGLLIGAGLSGLLISWYSIYTIFYINSVLYILSWLFLTSIKYKHQKNNSISQKVHFLKDTLLGLNYLKSSRLLIFLFFIGMVPAIIVNVLNSVLSAYTIETLQENVRTYGILDAVIAVGNVTMGFILILIKNKFSEKNLILVSILVISLSLFTMGTIINPYTAGISLFLLGAFMMLGNINIKTLLIQTTDNDYIGRVESINWIAYSTVGPLAAVLSSTLASVTKINYVFLGASIILIIIFILSRIFLAKLFPTNSVNKKTIPG